MLTAGVHGIGWIRRPIRRVLSINKKLIKLQPHNSLISMYPNAKEQVALQAAENLMESIMARYDPSHDAFHGQ